VKRTNPTDLWSRLLQTCIDRLLYKSAVNNISDYNFAKVTSQHSTSLSTTNLLTRILLLTCNLSRVVVWSRVVHKGKSKLLVSRFVVDKLVLCRLVLCRLGECCCLCGLLSRADFSCFLGSPSNLAIHAISQVKVRQVSCWLDFVWDLLCVLVSCEFRLEGVAVSACCRFGLPCVADSMACPCISSYVELVCYTTRCLGSLLPWFTSTEAVALLSSAK